MISNKMNDLINKQIQHELFSGHLYLSMGAYCSSIDLEGFASFFIEQEKEERMHAMKFYHYVNEQGGTVKIGGLDQPETAFKSLQEVFDMAWKHEQKVTGLINGLMDLAVQEKDYATQSFLKWYIDEQVEEEATMLSILNKIKLLGSSGHGLLMLDRELGSRSFAASESE